MAERPRIFISHSHTDNPWCRDFVALLRAAGPDVWYDERNLDQGTIMEVIGRELLSCPIFIVILSPAAVSSHWVRMEMEAAVNQQLHDPSRTILPVVAAKCEIPILWQIYKRIGGLSDVGITPQEAVQRVVKVVMSTPPDSAQTAVRAWEEAEDLRGRGQIEESLVAYDQAVHLDPGFGRAWDNKGDALYDHGQYSLAVEAYQHALSISPGNAIYWSDLGRALTKLERFDEALGAIDRAFAINPRYARAWDHKIAVLQQTGRVAEADKARQQRIVVAGGIVIRAATVADTAEVQAMRLDALRQHPEMFGSSYNEEANVPEQLWGERFHIDVDNDLGITYLAESADGLIAMSSMSRGRLVNKAHSAELWNVYVRPEWRGLRLIDRLVLACLQWAKQNGIRCAKLHATVSNGAAIRAYARCGFVVYGVEPEGLFIGGKPYDQVMMVRQIGA